MLRVSETPSKYRLRISGRGQTPVIVSTQPSLAVRVSSVLRGERGSKPAHVWNGSTLAFENPDGTMGEAVDLKGETGGIDNINGYILTSDQAQEDWENA